MAEYMDIYSGQIFETNYIPREAVRCEMYHNQEPLTEHQLNSIPTVDVRHVVRGEWVVSCKPGDMYPHMNCSVCNFYWREIGHRKYFKFCPNCGADMRGDKE